MPSLIYSSAPEGKKLKHTLEKPLTSLGSAQDNDVVLRGPELEAHHAVIHFDGTMFQIQAVGRQAVVYVNGKKRKKQPLANMDRLHLGGVELVFHLLESGSPNVDMAQLEFELAGYRRLQKLSEKVLDQYEVPKLLEELMDAVIDITRADKGFMILAEPGDQELQVRVARNINRETILDAMSHVSDSIIAKVIRSRHPLIVSDALSHSEFKAAQSVINLRLSSVMCVPLLHRGALLGVIYVGNENIANLFTRVHLDLLTVFASQASLILANAMMVNELRQDKRILSRRLNEVSYGSIIGACDAMRDLYHTIEKVAPTSVNVLILGETGTGKELIANELHLRSPRAKGPCVTINCGAIHESLLESELFGHVKGSFTGATHTRQGKFQAADGGTIFLDEIGEMPLNLQVKLLRVLQERTITKVGATQAEKVDIRVIAATNRNLQEAVRAGTFREDLYYRLNVVQLKLPPLRERGQDVILIAKFLIQKICEELGLAPKELAPQTAQAMLAYEWPGNIRQLENSLKKAIVMADATALTPQDLDLSPELASPLLPLAEAKERFAYRYIMEALERHQGNRTQTAKELDVDPRTIFRYLEKDI